MGPLSEEQTAAFASNKLGLKDLLSSKGNPYGAAAATATGVLDAVNPDKTNRSFKTRNAKLFKMEDTAMTVRKSAEQAAFASGNPYAMAAAGVSAIGRQVDKSSKDQYGIYKSTGAEVADRILDPVGNIQDLITGTSQKDLMHGKKVFEFENTMGDIAKTNETGAKIKNSTPGFTAPAYGRRGMKFKSRI